jgi:hypothetical protein
MWIRAFIATLLCSSIAVAAPFSISLRPELTLNFAQPSSFTVSVGVEARNLWRALGARAQIGFGSNVEFALDGIYRFDGSDQGNLSIGLGIGYSRSPEFRALVGYEWEIGGPWRIGAEANVRFPFSSDPRLGLTVMLVYLL